MSRVYWLTLPTSHVFCEKSNNVCKYLLAFSSFENKISQSAEFVLSIFGKSFDNVVSIFGGNCAFNNSIAIKLGIGFVGCGSYRFNLFVQTIIDQHTEIIDCLRKLMKKPVNSVPAGKLRVRTSLKAQVSSFTRWSSTAHMRVRFIDIKYIF